MCIRNYREQIYSECIFPKLDEPYNLALAEAIKFILRKFSVQGIIVTGSVIYGKATKTSDLDIFVVNNRLERQRIQKYFNGVPAEIFISPPSIIKKEMEESTDSGNCTTATMFSSSFIIYDRNQLVYKLRNKSKEIISRGPSNSPNKLQLIRYRIADSYENAYDTIETNPHNSMILISNAVFEAILYKFRLMGKWKPKHKEIMLELEKTDKELFDLAIKFYEGSDFKTKFEIAEKIMDITVKTHGFFEWESGIELQKE